MTSPFKYELMDLSNTHNAVADWLIANPGKGQLGRCAIAFDYTQSWLSTLIHQDAFQALMKIKQGKAFAEVIIPLTAKIEGVAHAGVMRMGEILDEKKDDRLSREITKDMLNSLGYGANAKSPGPGPGVTNIQNNTLIVDADTLAEARARRSQHYGRQLESPSTDTDPGPQTQTSELSHSEEPELGEARDLRSEHVNSGPPIHRVTPEGGEV